MEKRKTVLKWYNLTVGIVILFVAVIFTTGSIGSIGVETTPAKETRSDIINIDAMKIFGDLERPLVPFPHDKHTDAIEKAGGDCKACHIDRDNKLSQNFTGFENSSQKASMDNFHDSCIGCHEETESQDQPSGPVTCADCHDPNPAITSSRQPMGLDNSLHYRHIEAYDQKCEACHTECKTDVYKKGEETTCRHCHNGNQAENKVISLEEAVHESCIACHMTKAAAKKDTGPVKCAGCHDIEAQQSVEKVSPVPRLDRKQPATPMMKTGNFEVDESNKNRMDFVAFNHEVHEQANDTCRVCHHKAMSACNTCHTIDGSEASTGVSLEQAMHSMNQDQSCTGCHEALQNDDSCAGCHAVLPKKRRQGSESCLKCHAQLPVEAVMDEVTAKTVIEQRNIQTQIFEQEDIPETIIIKEFSDKYEPVEFPHRQIVNKIADNIKDNKLAAYFHTDKGTLCQGCHHNAPPSKQPAGCKSCHGKPFNEKDMNKPGIMGAYHIQCMECHVNMKIDKVGCTDCHQEKN